MQIRVENFGKIRSANVNLDGYTIFVGDNNSGKTYLMQLIYGVLDYLKRIHFPKNESTNSIESTKIIPLVNKLLQEKKEEIVQNTFKKQIAIGLLEINALETNFLETKKIFHLKKLSKEEYRNLSGKESTFLQEENEDVNIFSIFEDNELKHSIFAHFNVPEVILRDEMLRFAVRRILKMSPLSLEKNIFLPASRSGLMLTRPFVFANKNEDNLLFPRDSRQEKKENEFGLTQPVYDFLNFLQTHKPSERKTSQNAPLISFINKNIIHGEMKPITNEYGYKADGAKELLHPSHTSSMVNEISPIVQILTSVRKFQFIFYDEIETCQHPTTQIQMARLLNRMVNANYKMIVSTHSDTMATAINIAIAIEKLKDSDKKLAELGYEKTDILKNSNVVHAYQFIKNKEGTVVEEVKRHASMGLNFDFTLFNEANKKLFDAYQHLK